mgnify:CR=1 FL=1
MKWPNLKHLHYLVTLHQEQHFHRAAQRCNVSQSTLSTAIQNLEEHFGSQLLEREHKTFVFTSLGLDIVERSKVLLQEAGELVEYAQNAGNWQRGTLKLGVIPTIAPFILAQLLDEVHKQLPKIQLHLHEAQSEKIVEKLEHGNLDMVVLALPFDTRGLKVAEVAKESLFLVCNKSDIASQAKSLDDLDLSRLMLLEEGHCLRDHTLSACPIGERKNDHRLKASSLPTLVEMVSADLGFTLLPEIAIHTNMIKANPDLMVKQIEAAPSRILALVTRKSTPLQSEFDVLLQILQKITQDLH